MTDKQQQRERAKRRHQVVEFWRWVEFERPGAEDFDTWRSRLEESEPLGFIRSAMEAAEVRVRGYGRRLRSCPDVSRDLTLAELDILEMMAERLEPDYENAETFCRTLDVHQQNRLCIDRLRKQQADRLREMQSALAATVATEAFTVSPEEVCCKPHPTRDVACTREHGHAGPCSFPKDAKWAEIWEGNWGNARWHG